MRLVLASNNPGKLAELQALFAPLGLVLSEDRLWMRLIYWIGFGINIWCRLHRARRRTRR